MPKPELVLLVDGDSFQPVTVTQAVNRIITRLHVSPTAILERAWQNVNDERALSGQRIFREVLPAPPPEEKENPLYDETDVRIPLK